MIQSMTGYGKHVVQLPSKKITIELKSLNSKSLDINARLPQFYREKELELRKMIAGALNRGKVDFNLYVEITGEETTAEVNKGVVKNYMEQLADIAKGDDIKLMEMALRMPDTLKTDKDDIDQEEYKAIIEAMDEALSKIVEFRNEEGKVLEEDFVARLKNLNELLEAVKAMDPERLGTVRERLDKAVADLKVELDANRFEQELIYYLEKYDITEEKVRLANHLKYFETTLNSDDSNGKKLGFISQEIGREINTIGSKANYAPMQQLVVQMKDELEKIKEQMLNVL
ncbi:YicC/YloC family endoribonuclease [Flagellimonas halotolerans]|uniref:YicC/YloC family endoribonuclease n=1 Tax=Flagellimonas halotolerans TaxID=3112164 RepID=A0ABU6ILP4_9FLAO|nr:MULTISPECIES: YicC/YloC family endoribonuclease [unclassified Allomuricauda]MEC3964123.1 YicC/YloC family endoribonuclease [Muricauda sp. SYSU M86414]MEC4263993.1 YicC/YloC family endoribonuclease [Muricauda sp. SYSU M84420]